jgi:hypothetical protein
VFICNWIKEGREPYSFFFSSIVFPSTTNSSHNAQHHAQQHEGQTPSSRLILENNSCFSPRFCNKHHITPHLGTETRQNADMATSYMDHNFNRFGVAVAK